MISNLDIDIHHTDKMQQELTRYKLLNAKLPMSQGIAGVTQTQ